MDHYGCVDAASSPLYKGYRYPVEIISHWVWLYHRFPLSLREVEEMMMERGVIVSSETIRAWCTKFGQALANQLRGGPSPTDARCGASPVEVSE
jgi:putative transposase